MWFLSWSQGVEGVRLGDFRFGSLLFADDVVLLAPSVRALQLLLDRFAAECEVARMKISKHLAGSPEAFHSAKKYLGSLSESHISGSNLAGFTPRITFKPHGSCFNTPQGS